MHASGDRRERVALLIRSQWRIAIIEAPWHAKSAEVVRASWRWIVTASDVFGEYPRLMLLTRLDEPSQRRVERQLQRRSAGASAVRVFGLAELCIGHELQADRLVDALLNRP